MPSDLLEARAMEPATLGRGVGEGSWGGWEGCWGLGAEVGAVGGSCALWMVEMVSELDLVGEGCRLWGLLVLVLVGFLLPGAALRLRPLRYSSAGFRKMPVLLWTMSEVVPSRDDVTPVTGSQRWFSMRMGFER